MSKKAPVLLIDDEEEITFPIATFLEAKGYAVTLTNDGAEGLRLASAAQFPLIVSDIYIDRVTGLDILKAAKKVMPSSAVILMTARGSVRTTVDAESSGAFDYLSKPIDLNELLRVLQRAELSLQPPEEEARATALDEEIVGTTPVMVRLYKDIARAARSQAIVLIRGETGSGKELVARAIHAAGKCAEHPFLAVDCTAIPETLWESELFGSTRGAFTSAEKDRAGIIEQALDGTVFLDEIGEIPISFQAKLLRLLEAREYRPVGASTAKTVKARILAATHRQLESMVQIGEFRSDLYHRLKVLQIEVPPLRERKQDIPLLADRFLADVNARMGRNARLEPAAMKMLESYPWPGNVRELKNAMERMVAMSPPGPLGATEVRQILGMDDAKTSSNPSTQTLEQAEKEHVLQVLRDCGGNRTLAAEHLNIQRRTLYKKLDRWGLLHEGHSNVPGTQASEQGEES
ncbi:MAG TPA: sigma-54 dependent transcriptional regulator [Terracidiphilus sp.]|nr:sigma-54 dependent transcriptional regulator [Terracidiphilus sp.]